MISGLDSSSELFLTSIARMQRRMGDATLQVSSGKRVTVASDAPDEVSALLRLKADQRHTARLESNLGMAKTDADTADETLGASIRLMDRALQLAAQGANQTLDADKRLSLAHEVESLQAQMQSYSRTFTVPPTFQVEDPAGGSFAAAKGADEIFDHHNADGTVAADNVFTSLDNLRIALQNNDTSGITTAIDSVKTASIHVNSMEAFYGTVQTRRTAATEFAP